jgi:ADP-ribosylglycohydrolase
VAGEFTDDTSTALLLGESLISCLGFSGADQLNRYYEWYTTGHLGSNNECFDIGIGTRKAVLAYKDSGVAYPKGENETRAGNGSLMRLAPLVLAFYNQDPTVLLHLAVLSSRTTHTAVACSDACKFFASLIAGALHGKTKSELLDPGFFFQFRGNSPSITPTCDGIACENSEEKLCNEIQNIVDGSYKLKQPPEIIGGGYVVHALEAALWAFASTDSFKEGALKVANLGNDADTTAAIYGQLAGAFYGESDIPLSWRSKLAFRPFIEIMADEMARLSLSNGFSVQVSESTSDEKVCATDASHPQNGIVSEAYRNAHTCLILLEKEYAVIKKRIEPGPNQFKTIAQLDQAVQTFSETYHAFAPECDVKEHLLQVDWVDRIIKTHKTKLELKLQKPKIVLPFALKKN